MESLSQLPEGVVETQALLDRVDECFMLGFSRLGSEQLDALASLARLFSTSPLEGRLVDAVTGISRAEFREEHFTAIAAARSALQGAQYDALMDSATRAVGLQRAALERGESPETPGPITNWMTSTRQWLLEIALAGFMQLDQQNVAPFVATLEQLQQDGRAPRLAMLLTGYVHELSDAIPVSQLSIKPRRRWTDLWCRAMVSALSLPPLPTTTSATGTLYLLGLDLRHHTNVVSAVFYGILEQDDAPRVVRISASAYKVDLVTGDEIFQAFDAKFQALFEAWSHTKALAIKGMALRSSGDLIWDEGAASAGKSYDLFAVANTHLGEGSDPVQITDVSPEDRHPVQIAVPFHAQGYKVAHGDGRVELDLGDATLAIDGARMSDASTLSPESLVKSAECVALLRFDAGEWCVQPLVARNGKTVLRSGSSATTKQKSGSTLSVLQERASKLLRKKS